MTEPVIQTSGLRRTFGKQGEVEAVAGVDLRVEAGSIFGFLGPNGAGKTTTLRILALLAERAAEAVGLDDGINHGWGPGRRHGPRSRCPAGAS